MKPRCAAEAKELDQIPNIGKAVMKDLSNLDLVGIY